MKNILKDEYGISPIVGSLLIIVIMFFLSMIVIVFALGFDEKMQTVPRAAIDVRSNADTVGIYDIKIEHKGGDAFKGGWSISIVPVGQSPSFKMSDSNFSVGEQIITATLTNGNGNYTVNNREIYTDDIVPFISGEKYNVKMILYPYNAIVVDEVVEVR